MGFSKNRWTSSAHPIVNAAAAMANKDMQAKYDANNPAALKRLVQAGSQLKPFPQDVMQACFKAASNANMFGVVRHDYAANAV